MREAETLARLAYALALLLLAAPLAMAADPLNEQVCDETLGCVGVGTCVTDVCVPSPCDPTLGCRGDVTAVRSGCAANETITGQTCGTYVSVGAGTRRQTSAPLVGEVGRNDASAQVGLTDGRVLSSNLPNTWISPDAAVDLTVAGVHAGRTSVALYRSDIALEGEGPFPATPVTTSSHQFSQLALAVSHEGDVAGTQDATVAVLFLDLAPEGCFVRSTVATVPDVECSDLRPLLP